MTDLMLLIDELVKAERAYARQPNNRDALFATADAMAAITTVAVDLVVERYPTEPLSLLGGLHHQYVRI
jgi:hypothetical protein